MKLCTVILPDDLDHATARIAVPGLDWIRLDDTMLYWTADDELWGPASERARSTGLTLEERPAPGLAGDLHLVTQVGRVFQHEHPGCSRAGRQRPLPCRQHRSGTPPADPAP